MPHPAVHLVFEPYRAAVFGVHRERDQRMISGRGWAVGTKFRPAGFASFVERPICELTGAVLPLDDLFKEVRRIAARFGYQMYASAGQSSASAGGVTPAARDFGGPTRAGSIGSVTTTLSACPGCGVVLPAVERPAHPYMTSSSACWEGYAALLAVQYASPERMAFHQLVVDAFAAQHPGEDDPRAIQSVAIHLMTMGMFLEDGVDPALGTSLHRRMAERPVFHRLQRQAVLPAERLTWKHMPLHGPGSTARARAYAWARSVWAEWEPHHATVRGWLQQSRKSAA